MVELLTDKGLAIRKPDGLGFSLEDSSNKMTKDDHLHLCFIQISKGQSGSIYCFLDKLFSWI